MTTITIFENSAWIIAFNKAKTRLRITSKHGRGYATAYLAQSQLKYNQLGIRAYREPRVSFINGGFLPVYIRAKCYRILAMGKRYR